MPVIKTDFGRMICGIFIGILFQFQSYVRKNGMKIIPFLFAAKLLFYYLSFGQFVMQGLTFFTQSECPVYN